MTKYLTLHQRNDDGYNRHVPTSVDPQSELSFKTMTSVSPEMIVPSKLILGIPFHSLTSDQALDKVAEYIETKRGPHQICLSNAYTVSLSWKDNELRQVLDHSDLVLADGMSLVWGGRWIGVDLPGRIAGPDFSESLCANAEKHGYGIFFLGSTPKNLAALRDVLLLKWPSLKIVGMYSPPMCDKLSQEDNIHIRHELQLAKPDILFVGMSTPKQEKWIAANLQYLEVPVSIGIGAAFDFMSGRIPRAPLLFQKMGLEWLYRLYREPQRLWKRYLLGNFIFLSHLGAAWIRFRFDSAKRSKTSPSS